MATPRVSQATKGRHGRPVVSTARFSGGSGSGSGSGSGNAASDQVLSGAAARIAQEALKADVTVESLAKLAHTDAAFAMKLLALVNSPAFARSRTVSDINQAASLLGIRGLRTVALSLLVSSLCPEHESCRGMMANSLRRAVTCKLVAHELGYKDLDACFATGLFLDSGVLSHAQDHLELAVAISAGPAHHRVLREQAEGLIPHPVLGANMAEKFALPAETVAAIRHHHAEEPPDGALAQIAWLAEGISAIFESPDPERARQMAVTQARKVNLGSAQVAAILEEIPGQVASVAEALDSNVGEMRDVDALRNDAGRLLSEINQQYEGVIRKLGELLAEKEKLTEELRKANETLASLARTDALTGLPNRRALEDELTRSAARASRDGTWLSLLALDVDYFKGFNDKHGHAAGDAVLATVGRVLIEQCRKGDMPARYGGEEFTVILPNTNPLGANVVAERIRRAFEASETQFEGKTLKITMSVGVASAQGIATNPVSVLAARADEALYHAKRSGRNRVANTSLPAHGEPTEDDEEDTEITRVSALPGH
ncbi:MAG TPA: diguanylate cyclase [Polyangiaceae bacterium]|nr:diguanylate cyclase [Polyangiaceae bacterium]